MWRSAAVIRHLAMPRPIAELSFAMVCRQGGVSLYVRGGKEWVEVRIG